jgi:opacity protein-like surface antigen
LIYFVREIAMRNTGKHILLTHVIGLALALLCQNLSNAQGRFYYANGIQEPELLFELGITGGAMNCVTDIQGNPRVYQGPFAGVTLKNTNPTVGLYGAGIWKDFIGVRFEMNYGNVEGYDSLLDIASAPSAIGRYDRNLNFRSQILEFAVTAEFHPLQVFRSWERDAPRLSPYVFGGLAAFFFNPQGYTADGWVDLRPLRLEGQGFAEYPDREEYGKYAFAYPFGIGVRYDVSPKLTLRLEANKRTTFTDYLDDTHRAEWVNPALFDKYLSPSQAALAKQLYNRSTLPNLRPPQDTRPRGNPKENDTYWTVVFKLGFNLNRSGYGGGGGMGAGGKGAAKKLRCPNF